MQWRRHFQREEILRAAMLLFWQKGYSGTSLVELEAATRTNKSVLYQAFSGKMDLFLSSLTYYFDHRGGKALLNTKPLGLANIRRFLEISQGNEEGWRGCFAVNTLREVHALPESAQALLENNQKEIRDLLIKNIQAARPEADAVALADLTITFFAGLCIEQNLPREKKDTRRKIRRFMKLLEQV